MGMGGGSLASRPIISRNTRSIGFRGTGPDIVTVVIVAIAIELNELDLLLYTSLLHSSHTTS
jgi:hypothetical protein